MQTTKRRSAQAWREVVARFVQSGLTEEVFCEREGLGLKLFHRWRTKRSSATPRPVAPKPARVAPIPASTAGFVDLGSLKDGGSRLEMRLDLGGGVLLHMVRG
jgi:putative transposase